MNPNEGTVEMIVLGADTHKVSHTLAAVDAGTGQVAGERTVAAKRASFDDLLVWARGLDDQRIWAIEDCRHVSGALERFLLRRGECVVRVPPGLTAGGRKAGRERGKSDVIDAVAIARAALSEGLEKFPVAQLAGRELDVRLLVDHRERLVGQRTALINDLRWSLHDLWPDFDLPPLALRSASWKDRIAHRLARAEQTARVRICRDELRRIRELSRTIDALEAELAELVAELAPRLLAERGCGVLTAAKLIGEIAGIDRYPTDAKLARAAGSAPIPASSGQTVRYRLDKGGNRQLNCALHRLAVAKGRLDPQSAAYLARRQDEGKTRREAIRCLKRHLARRVWQLLQPPARNEPSPQIGTRPPLIAASGRTIHCNAPAGALPLT